MGRKGWCAFCPYMCFSSSRHLLSLSFSQNRNSIGCVERMQKMTWCDWTGVMECCGRGERSEPNDRLYLRNVATCASLLITDSEASSMIPTHGLPNDPCTTSAFYQRSLPIEESTINNTVSQTTGTQPPSDSPRESRAKPGGLPHATFRTQPRKSISQLCFLASCTIRGWKHCINETATHQLRRLQRRDKFVKIQRQYDFQTLTSPLSN